MSEPAATAQPGPEAVGAAALADRVVANLGSVTSGAAHTGLNALLGLVIGTVVAIVAAVLASVFRVLDSLAAPVVAALQLPHVAQEGLNVERLSLRVPHGAAVLAHPDGAAVPREQAVLERADGSAGARVLELGHDALAVVRTLAADGHAVLVATHDVEFVAQVADEVVVLAEGEVVSSGSVRSVVAQSPSFAPQVTKVLGAPWLRVDEVVAGLDTRPGA